jgi:hypothetical protein
MRFSGGLNGYDDLFKQSLSYFTSRFQT